RPPPLPSLPTRALPISRALDLHRAGFANDFVQRRAIDVLHDQEVQFAVRIEIVSANDVRMIEGAGGPGFALEAGQACRILEPVRSEEHTSELQSRFDIV